MALVYKTLFEVKIFHEYYLTDPDGGNVFDRNLQKDRIGFLFERFVKGEPGINEELSFRIPSSAERVFRDHRLRLLSTYGGFKVAIEVIPQVLADGTRVYAPKIPLPDDIAIPVLLTRKNNRIDGYTNGRMYRATSAGYYFSSEAYAGSKVYPFLSNAIPPLDAAFSYEQGELADHGVNGIRAFYRDSANAIRWLDRNGTGYANETDRLLTPPGFYYTFRPADGVTAADFVLKDAAGNEVGAHSFRQTGSIRKVFVPVDAGKVLTVPETTPSPALVYTLEVSGDNGYSETLRLVFHDGRERIGDSWGLVHIKVRNTDTNFDLLDGAGLLIARKRPDGTYNPGNPVFEVRFRSRIAFWRYINEEGNVFQNNLHPTQLEIQSGKLVSRVPRTLSNSTLYYRKADNSLYYLPNPRHDEILRSERGRLYSDIYVSESNDLFPSGP